MEQVSEHVYIETKYLGCNVGVVITEQGPVVIDTPALPDDTLDLREQIRKLTNKRIAYLIYTHEHFDHVLGAAGLTKKIIAHKAALSDIEYLQKDLAGEIKHFYPDLYQENKDVFDNINIISPKITFTHDMTLYAGSRKLELSWVGGHSPASIMIYLPEDKLLFCGDNVDDGMPFVAPYSRFGEWIDALKRIEVMDIEWIVPGHGGLCNMEDVNRTRIFLETACDRIRNMIRIGAEKDKAVKYLNLADILPVASSDFVQQQVQAIVGMLWDEMSEAKV